MRIRMIMMTEMVVMMMKMIIMKKMVVMIMRMIMMTDMVMLPEQNSSKKLNFHDDKDLDVQGERERESLQSH